MKSKAVQTIILGGSLSGLLDLSAAFFIYGLKGIHPIRILQSIASGLLGADSYKGGLISAALGVLLHFFIAFSAAALYCGVSRRMPILWKHPVPFGLLYGVAVYAVMHVIVLPLSAYPHTVSRQLDLVLTGLTVHMLCVGLPISLAVRHFLTSRTLHSAC